ncbi:EAL domain-containing protein [Hafnia paralvei]|uniref:EAL domain-containing protein n=1 Tax=Hafnia paralvei TaxID=546367 RepID=UPI0038D24D76
MDGDVIPYIQPIIDSTTNALVGAEVLMRIKRNDGTIIPPSDFINKIEQEGKLISATRVIMNKIIHFLKTKQKNYLKDFISHSTLALHISMMMNLQMTAKISSMHLMGK